MREFKGKQFTFEIGPKGPKKDKKSYPRGEEGGGGGGVGGADKMYDENVYP